TVQAPAIVTIDSKTWIARRGSRHRDQGDDQAAAAGQHTRLERTGETQTSTPPERRRHSSVITARKAPAPVNGDGPRRPAIATARKPGSWRSDVPDTAPEEHKRRGKNSGCRAP